MTGVELVAVETLTPAESSRLADLEAVVEVNLQAFVEVGRALLEIRDSRLYRETHGTFEAYLDERWGMSRQQGYRLIDGARVAELVSPMGDIPANERQARELVPLLDQPDDLIDVMRELQAEHGERLTAEKVRAAVVEKLAFDGSVHGLKSSRSVEWYTPPVYVDAAREVLGGIDLDPASCAQANEVVQARRFYDLADDGLAREWRGRVFLNPPYRSAGEFVAKLLAEVAAGRVEGAVVLLNAGAIGTTWFQPLWDHLVCVTDHRIAFWNPAGSSDGPMNANVFVYLGPDGARFARVFDRFGAVVERSSLGLEEAVA